MTALALMYHDVVDDGRVDASGFPGGDAARYKLSSQQFREHLDAIDAAIGDEPHRSVSRAGDALAIDGQALLLTFDDGGVSGFEPVAEMLEARGWRGHFFVTTAYVGRPGFMSPPQLRGLCQRGHVIGSHSHTHPLRMARCSRDQLVTEWTTSRSALEDVLGVPVSVASVPGGDHSRLVAESAAEAGFKCLFTSEPTLSRTTAGGLTTVGRFAIRRSTTAGHVAALVRRKRSSLWREAVSWQMRLMLRRAGGRHYLAVRKRVLTGASVPWGSDPGAISRKQPS